MNFEEAVLRSLWCRVTRCECKRDGCVCILRKKIRFLCVIIYFITLLCYFDVIPMNLEEVMLRLLWSRVTRCDCKGDGCEFDTHPEE